MKIFSSTWIQKFKALGVTAKVGDVKASMLTEAQFNDPSWVLSDGRDVTGSAYEAITGNTNVPDMRDQFLRGKSATRSLGSAQDDSFKSHSHSGGSDTVNIKTNVTQEFVNTSDQLLRGRFANYNSTTSYTFPSIGSTGGSETRPKNIAVNYFIKVN